MLPVIAVATPWAISRSMTNSKLAASRPLLGPQRNALHAAEQEQSGLSRRVEDVLARAAVTLRNDTDEYLDREPLNSHHQDLFSIEISNGERRLKELANSIPHFKFLKTAMLSRFPDFKPMSEN